MKRINKCLLALTAGVALAASAPLTGTVNADQRPIQEVAPTQHQLWEQDLISSMPRFMRSRQAFRYRFLGPNARDLGGYRTKSGQRVKRGRIIRTQELGEGARNGLQRLHVRHVLDLRTSEQARRHPDPHELDLALGGTNRPYTMNSVFTDYGNLMNKQKSHHSYRMYGHLMTTDLQARRSYRKTFRTLLATKHGATVYHCIEGRDRTGATSALVLSALGVPRKTIYQDYLETAANEGHGNSATYQKMFTQLHHFFGTIHRNYGNVHGYLTSVNGVGLTGHQIHRLRAMYLSGGHVHKVRTPKRTSYRQQSDLNSKSPSKSGNEVVMSK